MAKEISVGRKIAYYLGTGVMFLGFILFGSTFVTIPMIVGDFINPQTVFRSFALQGFGGMALIVVGTMIRGVGAMGLAGSGVVLNPEQARQELGPYSRMAGGMFRDAFDEANVNLGGRSERIVMLKCKSCGKLNEEDSKFCQECGKSF